MSFLGNWFNKSENKQQIEDTKEKTVVGGQVSTIPQNQELIYANNQRTVDFLEKLTRTQNEFDAIQMLIDETPDGKMAYNTYLRLANQGVEIEFTDRETGDRVTEYDGEARAFCEQVLKNNASGLDGLVDILHGSDIARGGMATEVVISKDLKSIEEVVIIDPATLGEWKWLKDKKRYACYQTNVNNYGNKRDLYEGNFLYIPHQPKVGSPVGTLKFKPAVITNIQFYQLLKDSMKVLNRIGYPHYDIGIDEDKVMATATAKQRTDPEARKELFEDTFSKVKSEVSRIDQHSNFVHFSSVKLDTIGGGVNGSGIDVRAFFEVLEPLQINGWQLTPVMMGRLKSGSYSLGTAEYKIVIDTVETMRRNSKRMIEQILNYWCVVNGYNVKAKLRHNPIDWQKEIDIMEAKLKKQEYNHKSTEYGLISVDEEATLTLSKSQAHNSEAKRFEYVSDVLDMAVSKQGA